MDRTQLSAQDILDAAFIVGRPLCAQRMNHSFLLPVQRRALGGRLFADGPEFVYRVAGGLARDPLLFPDSPISGTALADKQDQAAAWLCYRECLQNALDFANDMFLQTQGEAIDLASQMVRQVQGEARLPRASAQPHLCERSHAMAPAILLLEKQRRKARKGAGKPRKGPTPGQTDLTRAEIQGQFAALLKKAPRPMPDVPPIASAPVVAEPVVAEPIAAQPAVAEPIAAQPVVAEPVAAQPAVAEPIAAQPAVAEPIAAQPVVAEPIVAQPAVAEPIAAQPAVAEPIAAQPAMAEPIAAQPAAAVAETRPAAERVTPPAPVSTASTTDDTGRSPEAPAAPDRECKNPAHKAGPGLPSPRSAQCADVSPTQSWEALLYFDASFS